MFLWILITVGQEGCWKNIAWAQRWCCCRNSTLASLEKGFLWLDTKKVQWGVSFMWSVDMLYMTWHPLRRQLAVYINVFILFATICFHATGGFLYTVLYSNIQGFCCLLSSCIQIGSNLSTHLYRYIGYQTSWIICEWVEESHLEYLFFLCHIFPFPCRTSHDNNLVFLLLTDQILR